MSTIGDLLALLHDADRLVRTFEGEFSDWVHPPPSNVLIVNPENVAGEGLRWGGAGPFPRALQTRRHIWFEQPDRLRVEVVSGTELVRLGVRDRESWWRWDRVHGGDTGSVSIVDGIPTTPPLLNPPLLSPASLIPSLRFEPVGTGERLGRKVSLARARPRTALRGTSDLSCEFEFDLQYGTVLRRAQFEDGRYVQVTEAIEARFGGPIDPGRFELDTSTGDQDVRGPRDGSGDL